MRSGIISPLVPTGEASDLDSRVVLEIEGGEWGNLPTLSAAKNTTFAQAKLEQSNRLDSPIPSESSGELCQLDKKVGTNKATGPAMTL